MSTGAFAPANQSRISATTLLPFTAAKRLSPEWMSFSYQSEASSVLPETTHAEMSHSHAASASALS
jgi:hypothetical protein